MAVKLIKNGHKESILTLKFWTPDIEFEVMEEMVPVTLYILVGKVLLSLV